MLKFKWDLNFDRRRRDNNKKKWHLSIWWIIALSVGEEQQQISWVRIDDILTLSCTNSASCDYCRWPSGWLYPWSIPFYVQTEWCATLQSLGLRKFLYRQNKTKGTATPKQTLQLLPDYLTALTQIKHRCFFLNRETVKTKGGGAPKISILKNGFKIPAPIKPSWPFRSASTWWMQVV